MVFRIIVFNALVVADKIHGLESRWILNKHISKSKIIHARLNSDTISDLLRCPIERQGIPSLRQGLECHRQCNDSKDQNSAEHRAYASRYNLDIAEPGHSSQASVLTPAAWIKKQSFAGGTLGWLTQFLNRRT